jgi:predicted aldo/keto reductase-like oxidoreductase
MREFRALDEKETALVFKAADIINSAVTVPCTGCRYCVEGCPMNIPIPEYFALYNADKRESYKLTREVWKKRSCWKKFCGWVANLLTPFV